MQQAALETGQVLGHYRIEEKVGEGGMGVVFRAFDLQLDREVAIKLLRSEALRDPERKRRFILEAKAASALNHPNIITIHAIEQSDGLDYIVMEFVRGRTLAAMIGSKLSLDEALRYALAVVGALARAHATGIVHRDIKPDNVLVSDDGQVKVLDFGLAKLLDAGDEDRAKRAAAASGFREDGTQFGAIIGTLEYLSPEQAAGGTADARSDVFSFGCVLYEMLTNVRPFAKSSSSPDEVLAAVQQSEPQRPTALLHSLPAGIERIVMRCLRKNPAERFQDMAAVKSALEQQIEALHSRARRARLRAIYAGIAVVALIAAGAVAWLWPRKHIRPPTTIIPVTTYEGIEIEPAISPDGTKVAFMWDGDKDQHFDLYVKPVIGDEVLRLTNTAPSQMPKSNRLAFEQTFYNRRESSPVWSADGTQIAFLRKGGGNDWGVFVVPATGGAERLVAHSNGSFDWSPAGNAMALAVDRKLVLFDLNSSQTRTLTVSPSGFDADRAPRFSPDGARIAFLRQKTGSNPPTICIVSSEGGNVTRVISDIRGFSGFDWTRDGKEIVYSWNSMGGQPSMYRVPVKGGVPEPVTSNGYNPSIARHARRLAYELNYYNANIYRVEIRRSPRRMPGLAGHATKVVSSTLLNDSAQFSPDATRIAFISNRSGNPEIWIADADGRHATQVTHLGRIGTGSPRWSPDGKWIAFDSRPEGNADIFKVSVDGGEPIRLTSDPSRDVLPMWSADGKWIFFTSNRTDSMEIWKIPADGGPAVRVTKHGGWEARLSADGQTIYYTRQPSDGLWQMPAAGGEETRVPGTPADVGGNRHWGIDREGVFFMHYLPGAATPTIEFFDFATHTTERLMTLERPIDFGKPNLAVSPDGRWLMWAQMDVLSYDIGVIDNFE